MSDGNGGSNDDGDDIIVIGKRRNTQSSSSTANSSATLSIIAHSGRTNRPEQAVFEFLRAIFVSQTDYDLDTRFTPKQKEIILKALQGLADHPRYGPLMEELARKGADINIIADYNGLITGTDHGRTYGKNDDGTVDRGETITIYINMNFGGAPTAASAFAQTIIHELIHSLGVPSLDAELDAQGSRTAWQATRDIFGEYDFYAPAFAVSSDIGVTSAGNVGGSQLGSAAYEIFSGSDFADIISPGSGGSLVYTGAGDDRIVIAVDGDVDEIIDGAGTDTIELPAGTLLSAVSARWIGEGQDLAILIDGKMEALIIDAAGSGAVEYISIAGSDVLVSTLPTATNAAPSAMATNTTVTGSFFGGGVASGATFDANGDALVYRLGSVGGECAEEAWSVDRQTGAISANFTRFAAEGDQYTFLSLIVSDGFEESTVSVTVRWTNPGDVETPISGTGVFVSDDTQAIDDYFVSYPVSDMVPVLPI